LYQGTTLVVPQVAKYERALAPEGRFRLAGVQTLVN